MPSTHQPMFKVAVLVSGNGSNLQVLIDAVAAGSLPIDIVGVISNKADAYALTRAADANIECCVLSHMPTSLSGEPFDAINDTANKGTSHTTGDVKKMDIKTFEQHALRQLSTWQPDLIVLAGFMRVLSGGFIDGSPAPIINLHPSLLPKFKGLNTHARAIEACETQHGCSVHVVTEDLDAGQVLTQAIMPMPTKQQLCGDASASSNVQRRVQILEHQLLPWTILLIAQGSIDLTMTRPALIPLPLKLWFDHN